MPPGLILPHPIWTKLNRNKCDTGRSASTLYQWDGKIPLVLTVVLICKLLIILCEIAHDVSSLGFLEDLHEAKSEVIIAWIDELDIQL